jgi:hypothetical protein
VSGRRPRRALSILAALVVVASISAACSSSKSSSPPTTTKLVFAPAIAGTTIVINGKTVVVPREEYTPGLPIEGQSAEGGQIIISKKGLLPMHLYGPTPITVTWTNLTSRPVALTIVASGKTSPEISPGRSWSMVFPKAGTIAGFSYLTTNGYRGEVSLGVPLPPIPTTTAPG